VFVVAISGCANTPNKGVDYGLSLYKRGAFDRAVVQLDLSIAELEESNPRDSRLSTAYLALGDIAKSTSNFLKAEEYTLKSLELAESAGSGKQQVLRNAKSSLGKLYLSQKRYEDALPWLKASVDTSTKKKGDAIVRLALDTTNVAVALAGSGKKNDFSLYGNIALQTLELASEHILYLRTRGDILLSLAKGYINIGEQSEANVYYQRSIDSFKQHAQRYPFDDWRVAAVEKEFDLFSENYK